MVEVKSKKRPGWTMQVFDSHEEAEAFNWQVVLARPKPDRMILLEMLRSQSYPDARTTPQGLQRVLRTSN